MKKVGIQMSLLVCFIFLTTSCQTIATQAGDYKDWQSKVTGTYKGSISNTPQESPAITRIGKDAKGKFYGEYEFTQDGIKNQGILFEFQVIDDLRLKCKWKDIKATGNLEMTFNENKKEFTGLSQEEGKSEQSDWSGTKVSSADEIIEKLDLIASGAQADSQELIISVTKLIEFDREGAFTGLNNKFNNRQVTEKQLSIYIWAIGLTENAGAIKTIIKATQKSENKLALRNAYQAVASIGGKQAGDYLLSQLDTISDANTRLEVFNLLGQMQYEPALPKMDEVLKVNAQTMYWQPIFVFGKMGDAAVPYLLTKISDPDINVRSNAIMVLGQWLIPAEAIEPLESLYWEEKDKDVRGLILSSLEVMGTDLDALHEFNTQVISREQDAELVKFASETMDSLKVIKSGSLVPGENKQVSKEAFQAEYDRLYKSAGKDGDYALLSRFSSLDDEPALKKLRERILLRKSEEAFHFYKKVNDILILNRLVSNH